MTQIIKLSSQEMAPWVSSQIPKRTHRTHKFTNGYLTAIVGSKSYPGAARLSTHGAARAGAGGVQVLIPESLWPLVSSFQPEIMPVLLKEQGGELSSVSAFETFVRASSRSRAILVGCGLGRNHFVSEFVEAVLSYTSLPTVIDGDALYILSQLPSTFREKHGQAPWILTPHGGEWQRLLVSHGYLLDDEPFFDDFLDSDNQPFHRPSQKFAQDFKVVVVLKSFPSYIYLPSGEIFENPTGNPAATTAGCGDLLAGIIAGFLAQGLEVENAARVGLYLAGKAADEVIGRTGGHSLMASDILSAL